VVRSGGRQFIFLKKQIGSDSAIEFQMIPVTAGAESEGYMQVQIPVSIDDTTKSIVTKGAFSLLSVLKNQGEEED
jgi:cobalt-zinc-cadmium efflux system membrane fusion protein